MQFSNVTVNAKANIYFEGRVISHTIITADGSKKTLGLIYPGKYHFGTDLAERMEILAGSCVVKLDNGAEIKQIVTDAAFEVPAKSGFDIEVTEGICEYVCSFIA